MRAGARLRSRSSSGQAFRVVVVFMARSPNGARRLIEGERRAAKIHVVLVQETHRQVFPLVGTKPSLKHSVFDPASGDVEKGVEDRSGSEA